jgi:CRISPR-associated endonuclease Csn1
LTEGDLDRLKDNDLNTHFLNLVAASSLKDIQQNGFFLPVKKVRVATRASEPQMVRQVPKAFQNPNRTDKHVMFYENGENYAMAIYSNFDGKKETREYELLSSLDALRNKKEVLFENTKVFNGKTYVLEGKYVGERILLKGKRIILFSANPSEIWENEDLVPKRLYTVKGIDADGIKLYFHTEARPTTDVIKYMNEVVNRANEAIGVVDKNGQVRESKLSTPKGGDVIDRYVEFPYIKFKATNFNGLIEGIDFTISYDGTISKL